MAMDQRGAQSMFSSFAAVVVLYLPSREWRTGVLQDSQIPK